MRRACVAESPVRYQGSQQYSIIALTDGGGSITERYAYTAYGTPTITNASGTVQSSSADDNRYLYTGREWDDVTKLYHFRTRPYFPRLGRFGSRDPIGYRDGLLLYGNEFFITFLDSTGTSKHGVEPLDCSIAGFYVPSGKVIRVDDSDGQLNDMSGIIGHWIGNFLGPGCQDVIYEFGPDSDMAQRMYQNHKDFTMMRDWYENGADTLCDCRCRRPNNGGGRYRSGCKLVKHTVSKLDFFRDALGLFFPLERPGDVHIEIQGSMWMRYRAMIDCAANKKSLRMTFINGFRMKSAARNPINRKPLLNFGCTLATRIHVRKQGKPCPFIKHIFDED